MKISDLLSPTDDRRSEFEQAAAVAAIRFRSGITCLHVSKPWFRACRWSALCAWAMVAGRLICSTGSLRDFVSRGLCKNISLCPSGKSSLQARPVPCPHEGRTRRHERWVRDAMDADGAKDEGTFCGRRSRVVPTPRRWRQVLAGSNPRGRRWQKSPVTEESAKETVKTIRVRERRMFPAEPVVTNARVFYPTRGYGCGWHPAFPTPSVFGAKDSCSTRARRAARRELVPGRGA